MVERRGEVEVGVEIEWEWKVWVWKVGRVVGRLGMQELQEQPWKVELAESDRRWRKCRLVWG